MPSLSLQWPCAGDEGAEARRIAQELRSLHSRGVPWGEMALLFRVLKCAR